MKHINDYLEQVLDSLDNLPEDIPRIKEIPTEEEFKNASGEKETPSVHREIPLR